MKLPDKLFDSKSTSPETMGVPMLHRRLQTVSVSVEQLAALARVGIPQPPQIQADLPVRPKTVETPNDILESGQDKAQAARAAIAQAIANGGSGTTMLAGHDQYGGARIQSSDLKLFEPGEVAPHELN